MKKEINTTGQELSTFQEVEAKAPNSNPLTHVGGWDFVILFLAILLRFSITAKSKIKELDENGESFNVAKYFDFKHLFRWLVHASVSLLAILILPEIFVSYIQPRYFSGLDSWTLLGSGVIGFLGYDIIRILEKVSLAILTKFGIKIE